MSSSAVLLDQDFGSESEDDNFNPAPADDSDNDADGDSNAEPGIKRTTSSTSRKVRTTGDSRATDGAETEKDGSSRANGNVEQLDDDDEDGENGNIHLTFFTMK
jgi:transcription elongation factor SPT5